MSWRGYLVLVLLAVLLGAGSTYVVLQRRGQRLATAALAQSAADSVRIAAWTDSSRAAQRAAQSAQARADSAVVRANEWRGTAARLGATAVQLRATLDTVTTALDSLPVLVVLVAQQDSTIAAKDSVIRHQDDAFAEQRRAGAALRLALTLAADSALAVAQDRSQRLESDLAAALRTRPGKGRGWVVGAGAGICTTGRPCVGLMVVKPLFRVPLT